jgi:transcriptional antiterminator NusG
MYEDEEYNYDESHIFAVKTAIGHERAAATSLSSRVSHKQGVVYSIFAPSQLRGYILVEAHNIDELRQIIKGVPHVRTVVEGETQIEEVEHFLTPKAVTSGVEVGNIVELISGPFKGEKARVQHIDEDKEEITVELFESMVPIPVTVKGEHVRVLDKLK